MKHLRDGEKTIHPKAAINIPAILKKLMSSVALLSLLSSTAFALDIQVTKMTDSFDGACDSDCSLREAVAFAGTTPGNHNIRLKAGTYSLTLPAPTGPDNEIYDEDENANGDLDVRGNLTITGTRDRTLIHANRFDRIFEIFENSTVTLQYLSFTGGWHHYDGGGIRNLGNLTLKKVAMINNIANYGYSRGRGGAIANYGQLTLLKSEFWGNRADFGDTTYALGGAIYNENTLFVRDTAFYSNQANTDDVIGQGGAIYNGGSADIARSVFLSNKSDGAGSAILNADNANLTVNNSTFQANYSDEFAIEGTITNFGTARLVHVTITGNVHNYGIDNRGVLTLRNSIVVDNHVDFDSEDVSNCINQGDYIYKSSGVLMGRENGNCTADIYYADIRTSTELFYPMIKEEHELEIIPLRPLSLALDAAVGSCSSHDQRGLPRPKDGNGDGLAVCDLGAYEKQDSQ